MQPLEWPSVQHIEFDRTVDEIDEFEHLPDIRAGRMHEASEPEDAPLNELILAGLVSPV
jgi:hypothetical protein